jgi:tetratricopeptide (TPR) repeat protein
MQVRPAQPATAWQLFMQSTWMPGEALNSLAWEKERVALARRALDIDPNLGQADSVLADKLAYLANVDPPSDTKEAHAEAGEHARRALDLAAGDADAMFNISNYHWHAGHISEAVAAIQRTLELDPNHVLARFLVKAVPYGCSAAPQSVIDDLIGFDARLSSDNPVRSVTLTWISLLYLNNGDFVRAAEAGRRSERMFRTPNTVYRLAASLVQLGDKKSAVDLINQQRGGWPNLDLRHYADVAIPRRCGGAPKAYYLYRIYSELADAVDAAAKRDAIPTGAVNR